MTDTQHRDPPIESDTGMPTTTEESMSSGSGNNNNGAHQQDTISALTNLQFEELRKSMKAVEERTNLEDFIVLPESSFFRKAPTMEEFLCWSNRRIKWPMTAVEKSLTKDVLKCFRDLQRIMGDRKYGSSKKATSNGPRALDFETIQRIIDLGLKEPSVRDEIYLHLLKQITNNPNYNSALRGWEVMCAYSTAFPPSKALIPVYLKKISVYAKDLLPEERAQICADIEKPTNDKEVFLKRVSMMHIFISTRLEKLARTGPRGHLPPVDEIANTVASPFRHQIFGVSLQEIMEYPENRDETGRYPHVVTFLSESILKLKGTCVEGIFRVPGFIDEVHMLRLRIERGEYTVEGITDPSTPASLLKLWLRELSQPVIPDSFYERCLMVGADVDEAIKILDEIPEINRMVLKYLIRFLQVVGDPRYQPKTKMTVANLAMVFAPNILRCPSDNPLVILANSRFEQNFLKTLVNYLEE